MIKVDLITGFLGSGKTTFLKKYAKYFIDKGQRVGVLENDYGAVNVDMLLLNELRGDYCELEMVAGGCGADCHKRRFKTKLISMGMSGYDRVIVEPSGIFDVDEFFDTLREDPLERWYEIGNVIAIVDARLEDDMSKEADFYLASQVANAGVIMLSRSQLVSKDKIMKTKKHLLLAAKETKLDREIEDIIREDNWDDLSPKDFDDIANSGYKISAYKKLLNGHDNDYSTVYFLEVKIDRKTIKEKINLLMSDDIYGKVLRVKGFFIEDGKWYQVNATKNDMDIVNIPIGQEVFIVIGENLNKEQIENLILK